jgi:magnesium-transporting ATPase (P-type)
MHHKCDESMLSCRIKKSNTLLTRHHRDLQTRRELYGWNEFCEPDRTSWLEMFLKSFEDTTLIVLIVAAVVSLAVGIYESPSTGWIEGAAILFAVLLVAVVTATNDYRKESQFRKLSAKKDDVTIGVIRNNQSININVKELVSFDHLLCSCCLFLVVLISFVAISPCRALLCCVVFCHIMLLWRLSEGRVWRRRRGWRLE